MSVCLLAAPSSSSLSHTHTHTHTPLSLTFPSLRWFVFHTVVSSESRTLSFVSFCAAVNSLPLVLKLLSVMQASDSSSSSSYRKTDELHFKLLYHGEVKKVLRVLSAVPSSVNPLDSTILYLCVSVSNIAGKLTPTNVESLLPALSYLYCSLSLCPAHCADRGQTHALLWIHIFVSPSLLSSSSSVCVSLRLSPRFSFSLLPCFDRGERLTLDNV